MHCVVYKCSNLLNSAAKENGISFVYLPQGCEEEKVLGKCCQQDRLVTTSALEIFSNCIMFGAFVDGWQCQS